MYYYCIDDKKAVVWNAGALKKNIILQNNYIHIQFSPLFQTSTLYVS